MEVDEIQTQACKFSRVGNKIAQIGDQYPEDDDDGEVKNSGAGAAVGGEDGGGRFRGWHSSRIFRVSRASGGKDRHSKVLTSKGLRDRRVRLSVTTAIQFYDLQDRLGYDQPSRAVEWLIKAAASAIAELPPLNNSFPDTPKQANDEKRLRLAAEQGLDSADLDLETDHNYHLHQHHVSMSKSACSTSTSETSKGSGLSLSRSEIRVKARERARERAAKEKENDSLINHKHNNVSPISQTSTFTELLTGGIGNVSNNSTSPTGSSQQNPGGEASLFHKSSTRQWSSAPMEYFPSAALLSRTHHSSTFPNIGNSSLPQSMPVLPFSVAGDHFQFGSEADYISSSLAGFNRGTLQSNSPSMFPHLQRFSPIDGSNISNIPFLIGTAATSSPAPLENHHQFPAGFDARLQLCYGDGSSRHSDQKGKGKN